MNYQLRCCAPCRRCGAWPVTFSFPFQSGFRHKCRLQRTRLPLMANLFVQRWEICAEYLSSGHRNFFVDHIAADD